MAIKGKKKSQTRGSQARRRPAAAPRPAPAPRRSPWYRTDRGRIAAAVVVAVAIGFVWWAVARAQGRAEQLQRTQAALESYTGEARALLQAVRPAAEGMARVPPEVEESEDASALREASAGWNQVLRGASAQVGEIVPTPIVATAHELFARSVSLYGSAAETYGLAARLDGGLAGAALARAATQRDEASALWGVAVRVLDESRGRAELPASGVSLPSSPALGSQPGPPGEDVGGADDDSQGGAGDG